MEQIRTPFQGVHNILRFNWHYYLFSAVIVCVASISIILLGCPYKLIAYAALAFASALTLSSLAVSYYVYDLSGLYSLSWLKSLPSDINLKIININAGFDEISHCLINKYPDCELIVLDFYDPEKHPAPSIKLARKTSIPLTSTLHVNTSNLTVQGEFADKVFVIFCAHEIRDEGERETFFNELRRVTKQCGKIIVTEHLRDLPNFFAYNIGFFHFFPKSSWLRTFRKTRLKVSEEIKVTPFITTFILEKNDPAS